MPQREAASLDVDVVALLAVVGTLGACVPVDDADVLRPAPGAVAEPAKRVTGLAATAERDVERGRLHPGGREHRAGALDQRGEHLVLLPEDVQVGDGRRQTAAPAGQLVDLDRGAVGGGRLRQVAAESDRAVPSAAVAVLRTRQ